MKFPRRKEKQKALSLRGRMKTNQTLSFPMGKLIKEQLTGHNQNRKQLISMPEMFLENASQGAHL